MSKPYTISLEECSEKTGIPISTLREYIKKDKLKATKPGKIVLIYWSSVEELLKKNEYKAS